MPRPKKCRHSKELDIGYGYGRASGWYGIGGTYRCKACHECLWFEDDGNYPDQIKHNNKKRKKNKRWNPDRHQSFHEKYELQRQIDEWVKLRTSLTNEASKPTSGQ